MACVWGGDLGQEGVELRLASPASVGSRRLGALPSVAPQRG